MSATKGFTWMSYQGSLKVGDHVRDVTLCVLFASSSYLTSTWLSTVSIWSTCSDLWLLTSTNALISWSCRLESFSWFAKSSCARGSTSYSSAGSFFHFRTVCRPTIPRPWVHTPIHAFIPIHAYYQVWPIKVLTLWFSIIAIYSCYISKK